MVENNKKVNGFVIQIETDEQNVKWLVARDSKNRVTARKLLKNIPGGIEAGIFNFKKSRTFMDISKLDHIKETQIYDSGVKRTGIYNAPGKGIPDAPNKAIRQYAIKVTMKSGATIYATSMKIDQNNLSLPRARAMAYQNLFKQFSAKYSTEYGEAIGKEDFERARSSGNIQMIQEGYVYYDVPLKYQKAI